MTVKVEEVVQGKVEELVAMSRAIWEYAEVGLKEHKSAALQADALEKAGFEVQRGVAGMPSAFVAGYGTASPVIAILGEFDALPGLSQIVEPMREPLEEGAPGHGCGHNLLGVGGVGAALAVKDAIEQGDVSGTIRYYGCPAEETLVGKVFMVRDGLFDDVDAALTWHPSSTNGLWNGSSLALNSAKFRFYGRSSHAAANPEAGRSALDAVELMNVAANYLREHIPAESRMHYVVTSGGGEPNVVPAEAEVWYYVRAPRRDEVEDIYSRLLKIAEGATLMTETSHEVELLAACYPVLSNQALSRLLQSKLEEVGPATFSDSELEFAGKLQETFTGSQLSRELRQLKERGVEDEVLHQGVLPFRVEEKPMSGSTDVGDVSWVVPTAQFSTTCSAIGTPGHSWQLVVTSGMSIGEKGMVQAAKVLAASAVELMQNTALLDEAKAEFGEATTAEKYHSPVGPDARPPLHQLGH